MAAGTDLTLEWCDLPSACAALRFSTATGRSDCVCFLCALIRFSLSPCVRTLFPFSSVGDCRADSGPLLGIGYGLKLNS